MLSNESIIREGLAACEKACMCASFHKKVYLDLKKNYIDKNLVKFEHHAFPLDLAALSAEKIVRCALSPEAKFNPVSYTHLTLPTKRIV